MITTELHHGDCLEVMKNIPDNSIDMVLTDPPYGTTACSWDTVIPFEPMWNELKRITKDNGAICLFGSEPFSSALRMSNIKMFKYDWIWKKSKSTCFQLCKKIPLRIYEIVSVFYNNPCVYIPQNLKKLEQPLVKKRKDNQNINSILGSNSLDGKEYKVEYTNYPINILEFGSVFKTTHQTEKPVDLLEYLVKTYTNVNDTVLDFTMGSGSTGEACVNTLRNFIGIEMQDNYFINAKERIHYAKKRNDLC